MIRRVLYVTFIALLFCLLGFVAMAQESEIGVAWDAVTNTPLSGYRVFYGTDANTWQSTMDVGVVTEVTVGGLLDNTTYYLAVKAVGVNGLESAGYSNIVTGWPRPRFGGIVHQQVSLYEYLVTVGGANFQVGAEVISDDPQLQVTGVNVSDNNNLQYTLTLLTPITVPLPVDVIIRNPTGVYGKEVAAFTIQPAIYPADVTGVLRRDVM
jgi:hypothetical protein